MKNITEKDHRIEVLDDSYRRERLDRQVFFLRLIHYWSYVSLLLTFAYFLDRALCNINMDGSLSFWDTMAIWSFFGVELGNAGKRTSS